MTKLQMAERLAAKITIEGLPTATASYMFSCLTVKELKIMMEIHCPGALFKASIYHEKPAGSF